ncbi:MAG TPA: glycosyltransferase family 87 protein [Gemmataceae bacterium]|nr:glycosyltransferase family 87 protein [Gemmataceae bacterium]
MEAALARLPKAALLQRIFLVGLISLFLALSVQYGNKVRGGGSAILRWRNQLLDLGDENIYTRYAYPNPPIMALLLEPIASLPPLVGSLLWFYLRIGMAVGALLLFFRIIETKEAPFPTWAKNLTILLSLRPIMGDLTHGNVNIYILFLVAAGLYAFHQRRDYLGGATIALAIACKVTPALFIPYFLWKRAWKALAGIVLGLFLFLFLVPSLFLGVGRNLELLHSWTDQMVTPFVVQGVVTSEHQNQSLPGLLYRLTTASPSFLDEHADPMRYDNLLTLDHPTVKWILKGCMLAFAAMIVWSCRTPLSQRQGWRLAAEFSLVMLGMLIFSERTWKHHCVTMLAPFAVLSYYLAVCRPGRVLQGVLIALLVIASLLMASTSTSLFAHLDAKMAEVYGAYLWAIFVLVAAMVVLLSHRDAKAPGLAKPDVLSDKQRDGATILHTVGP